MLKMNKIIVNFKVRRLDCGDEDKIYQIEINSNIVYEELKMKILELLNMPWSSNKIIKIRNSDGVLIPLMSILDNSINEKFILIDITNIHQDVPVIMCDLSSNSVYMDAVRLKLRNMESRVAKVESLVPHLKWRKQSLLELATYSLGSQIAFLDRRIDELTPREWNDVQKSVS